jgi:capsular exopolysaccharide synthesis family protein
MSHLLDPLPLGPGRPHGSHLQSPVGSPQAPDGVDFYRFIHLLWRNKLHIVLITVATILAGLAAVALQTTLYESTVLLQVSPDAVNPTPYADPFDAMSGKGNYESYVRTQLELLTGATVRDRVIADMQSRADSIFIAEIPELYRRFHAERVEGSQLLRLRYTGETPEVAAAIVNSFAEQLIAEQHSAKQEARAQVIQSLRDELMSLESKLQLSERELADYTARNQIYMTESASGATTPNHTRLVTVENNLVEAEATRIAARSHLERLKSGTVTVTGQLSTPTITSLADRLTTLRSELGTLLTTYGDRWPAVVAKRDEIAYVQRQLDEEKSAARQSVIEDAQLEYDIAESRYKMLDHVVALEHAELGRQQRASIEYNLLRREVETNEELYAGLLERLKQGTLMDQLSRPNLQILERGTPNANRHSPQVLLQLALSLFSGLGLGVGLVVVRDHLDRSVTSSSELERALGLPPLGALPLVDADSHEALGQGFYLLPAGHNDALLAPFESEAAVAPPRQRELSSLWREEPELREAVFGLCTSILLAQTDQPLNVIAVTSAVPGEGKTTVSKLLARALASSGQDTLLIDGDLRVSKLSEPYSEGRQEGLSLLLSGNTTHAAIRRTDTPSLYLLTAGPKPPNAVALLNSSTMARFLEDMRARFRFIIIDTPPIIGLADARVISAQVDGVVLIVKAGHTKSDVISKAWALIERSGGRGLGVLLNGTAEEETDFPVGYAYSDD